MLPRQRVCGEFVSSESLQVLSGLIGRFSSTYLHRDPGFFRFFVLLHLFAFGSLLAFAAGSFESRSASARTSARKFAFDERISASATNPFGHFRARWIS